MNQPSPTVSETAPSAPVGVPSLDERVASVNKELDDAFAASGRTPVSEGEIPPVADVDGAAPAAAEVNAQGVVVDAPVVDAAAAQRAAERRQRLDALSAKQRDQVDRKAALAAQDRMARDLAAAQARAEAAEAQAGSRVDVSGLDEAGFFALAEAKGIKPENLQAWLVKAVTSPEKVAEAAALKATQQAYDPKFEAVTRENSALKARLDALEAREQQHVSRAEEQRQTQAFLGMVSQSTERAPLAAKLLAADPDEFMEMAEVAAKKVPGQGPHALLDAVEEMLDGDGRKFAQKYANLYGLIPSQPQAPVQPTTRGAAMPKTVSNSLAQSRTALVDERDFASLTLEERAAILKRP